MHLTWVCLPYYCTRGSLLCCLCCFTCTCSQDGCTGFHDGQIREVETGDMVETLVSMHDICTVSHIFSPVSWSKWISFYASGKAAVCVIQKGRKYLTPFVVKLAPAYNKTLSVALCNSQNTLSSCFVTVLCLSLPEGQSSQKVLWVLLKILEQNLSVTIALKDATCSCSAASSQFRAAR